MHAVTPTRTVPESCTSQKQESQQIPRYTSSTCTGSILTCLAQITYKQKQSQLVMILTWIFVTSHHQRGKVNLLYSKYKDWIFQLMYKYFLLLSC